MEHGERSLEREWRSMGDGERSSERGGRVNGARREELGA